ncbi:uncharacterized protein PgNI_08982 [Pyricularia grisea]|uniref:Conserved oligomeric Golgi complex subunit 1 n=1 Tax=Pyricularia grisea TaxID=148305 RepID=A0A6P8AWC0_PYRGI|nr:uncharacterized protein PgNI_08982 [Pyricularia grisea]TLD06474.1 hypothetical protein PgNI_08982 [Pyricularia grisea]
MTAPTIDLSTITSAEQVFTSPSNTLPQIRAIHKALHAQIDDRATRLRTQVGTSYRDLLGTADAIVRMRRDMAEVQAVLGRMGGRCGRAVVGAKAEGLQRFVGLGEYEPGKDDDDDDDDDDDEDGGDADALLRAKGRMLSVAARARLLDACALAARRVLRTGEAKRGDRLLVAAKVLLLSRLVGKSLSEGGEAVDPQVRASIDASWKSLRRRIEKVLEVVDEDLVGRDDVVKALCAYSLATNAGCREVLGFFLRVRARAMTLAFALDEDAEHEGDGDQSSKAALTCLRLFTRTMLDVQALMPTKLVEALKGLKKKAILEDEALLKLEGLRLDLSARWCGDEIRYYKPYIRHDDIEGKQAKEMLTGWAERGGETLIKGLERTLTRLHDLGAVLELRSSVLQCWIRDGGRIRGYDPAVMLDQLRTAINTYTLEMLAGKVHKLRLVGSEMSATLDGWRAGVTDEQRGLWDDEGMDLNLSGGAALFAQDVVSRLYGRNDAVSKAVNCYESWHQVVKEVDERVKVLRKQRWDNDADEIEDEETIEQRQQILSSEDPQTLQDQLSKSLETAFRELDEQIAGLWKAQQDGQNRGHVAMYLTRVIRDIRSRLPDEVGTAKTLGTSLIPQLHEVIVKTVVAAPLEDFTKKALARTSVIGRSLWEGEDPALPSMPSAGVFTFLRALVASMGDAGLDLWSPTAVATLKSYLRGQLREAWLQAVEQHSYSQDKVQEKKGAEIAEEKKPERSEGPDADEEEGAKEDEDKVASTENDQAEAKAALSAEQRKELFTQWLYDVLFLQGGLGTVNGSSEDELKDLEDAMYKQTELDNDAARKQLSKSAQEYWKRTSLLFGFLA